MYYHRKHHILINLLLYKLFGIEVPPATAEHRSK